MLYKYKPLTLQHKKINVVNLKESIQNFSGELYDDVSTLALYSTDASIYQKMPQLVAVPKNIDDLRSIIQFANTNKIPVVPKGSATSLAGQAVNEGIAIDFTKYFNSILEINAEQCYAVVQPGVTREVLNKEVLKHNLHFAPDPATSSRATFGGMIANNSSGTKSILYGKSSEHVIELKIMTTSGEIFILNNKTIDEYNAIAELNNIEGNIYKKVREIIFENTEEINERFPTTMRRVGGYALDAFVKSDKWNLANLIIGSEGTLAIILEAKVLLTSLPQFQNMVIVHFDDRIKGIAAVKDMIQFKPSAVEMLDFNVLNQSKQNLMTKKYYDSIITGAPQAVMTVEFYGETKEDVDQRANQLVSHLKGVSSAYAYPIVYEKSKINDALSLRKDGLGLIMSKPGIRKPLPFVEDAAIPLEHLAEYVDTFEKFCLANDSEIVMYAHASVGVLHIRPTIDLTNQTDIDKMKKISDYSFDLVKKYKGSWSSEHGDGRVRSPKMKEFYGEKIYNAFKQVKNLFDPNGIMNPNIILEAEDMRKNLRYHDNYKDQQYPFIYKYRNGGNFQEIVHNCSGVGACRNTESGTMCPSFRATGNEADSTRGRANILRLAMSGQMQFKNLEDDKVKEVLDLCLSCKACKTECPSNVDMAKLKSEVLQISYDKKGTVLKEKMPLYASYFSKTFSGAPARIVNSILKSKWIRNINHKLLGIHKDRILPEFATQSLASWYKNTIQFEAEEKVVLFADTYINYHEVELGKHIIHLLNKGGVQVILADIGCCQRPKISNGFLREAKKELEILADKLYEYTKQGLKIITVEPSCTTALIDDLPDLIEDAEKATSIKSNVIPSETYFLHLIKSKKIKGRYTTKTKNYIHHGHCHQKAVYTTKDANELLQLAGGDGKELDTGCCGMAGAFGYEAHHYEISKIIGNQKLIPLINSNKEKTVIANGYSCRHQINDLSNVKSIHVMEYLQWEE